MDAWASYTKLGIFIPTAERPLTWKTWMDELSSDEKEILFLRNLLDSIVADLKQAKPMLQAELAAARDHYGDPDAYANLERLLALCVVEPIDD